MKYIYDLLDYLLDLNKFYDVRNQRLSIGDQVTINYTQKGFIDREGLDFVLVSKGFSFELRSALRCFRVEKA